MTCQHDDLLTRVCGFFSREVSVGSLVRTYINGGLLGKGPHGVDVVVQNDDPHHHLQAEQTSVFVL